MDLNGLSEEKQNGLLLKWGVNLNLEPETVENILNSVEATCITEYKQEDSKRENINLTKNEINCDSFIRSEKTLSFVCSEFSYVRGEESTNYPEESKGKHIQIW